MRVRSGCVYSTLSDSDKRRPPAIDSQREPATGGHLCPAAWGETGYRRGAGDVPRADCGARWAFASFFKFLCFLKPKNLAPLNIQISDYTVDNS